MSKSFKKKAKREVATKSIRIYPSTLALLQTASADTGKSIVRILHETVFTAFAGK